MELKQCTSLVVKRIVLLCAKAKAFLAINNMLETPKVAVVTESNEKTEHQNQLEQTEETRQDKRSLDR